MKVLLLSVGGSDAPVVISAQRHQPDLVIFFCTGSSGSATGSRETVDGEGLVCVDNPCFACGHKRKKDRKSIAKQLGLEANQYKIEIVPPDNIFEIYQAAERVIAKHISDGHQVMVDYTGGTKSMSVGLAAAAMEYNECTLSLVKGPRLDLLRVRDGMEQVAKLSSNLIYLRRQKKLSQNLLNSWNYHATAEVIAETRKECGNIMWKEQEEEFERALLLCRGFAAWDKFNYAKALPLVEIYKKDTAIAPYNKTLKKIKGTLDWYENWQPDNSKNPPDFSLVYDLLLNAERRATQGDFDDAIARIYRAVEMYAQFCLRTGEPRLTSDDLDITKLPASCRTEFTSKHKSGSKIQIALKDTYEVLSYLNHPVGQVWTKWRSKILHILNERNFSFLAHGMRPLQEENYQKVKNVIWEFIEESDIKRRGKIALKQVVQLPQRIWRSEVK